MSTAENAFLVAIKVSQESTGLIQVESYFPIVSELKDFLIGRTLEVEGPEMTLEAHHPFPEKAEIIIHNVDFDWLLGIIRAELSNCGILLPSEEDMAYADEDDEEHREETITLNIDSRQDWASWSGMGIQAS